MNILLIFFAIPVATIILSAILETLIHCPYKVAGIFFSIFLVVAAALGITIELFFAVVIYTIISFITAFLVKIFKNRRPICCNYRSGNDFNNNNNNFRFNNFNSVPFEINNEEKIPNSLPENDNISFNMNNANNGCRRYR